MVTALLLILRVEGLACVLAGAWGHNLTLMLAGAACWAVGPLLGRELDA